MQRSEIREAGGTSSAANTRFHAKGPWIPLSLHPGYEAAQQL